MGAIGLNAGTVSNELLKSHDPVVLVLEDDPRIGHDCEHNAACRTSAAIVQKLHTHETRGIRILPCAAHRLRIIFL